MQTGIVAKKIGVSVDATRFYKRNGLLPWPPRTEEMSAALAQLSIATAQRQAQFALQLVKIAKFLLYVGWLLSQPVLHRRARLAST